VVLWFKAGILSWQPGFDSPLGKPHKKRPKRSPKYAFKEEKRLARQSFKKRFLDQVKSIN